jgi:hypothetical protein
MSAQYASFKITNAGGVTAYTAVVQDTTGDGLCKIPTAANAKAFLGIVTDDQLNQNQGVSVQMTEDVTAIASGAIAVGDLVNIANNTGQLQSCQATVDSAPGTAGVLYVVGQALTAAVNAGDFFRLQIRPHEVKTAVS